MGSFKYSLIFLVVVLFSACKSQAPVQTEDPLSPSSRLVFTAIHAETPSEMLLDFQLEISNPGSAPDTARLESWKLILNGTDSSSAFKLETENNPVFQLKGASEGPASFPLTLKMDMASLVATGLAPLDFYDAELILELTYGSSSPERFIVAGLGTFPGVLAPEFHILNIAILKAELVNTIFRVALRMVNPNPFNVELSSFNYELYGNGRFWAEGNERNIIQIPARSSIEGYLFMMMNFIDMDRNLLDQIINLVDVNYRFEGEAQVSTGVEFLPSFNTAFNLSGYSRVYEN